MNQGMTSRERVKAAFEFREGDRAPIDFSATHNSGINVVAEVRELIEIFKPGGGYIFCPIHDIQEEVPPDKVLAIYETAKEHLYY